MRGKPNGFIHNYELILNFRIISIRFYITRMYVKRFSFPSHRTLTSSRISKLSEFKTISNYNSTFSFYFINSIYLLVFDFQWIPRVFPSIRSNWILISKKSSMCLMRCYLWRWLGLIWIQINNKQSSILIHLFIHRALLIINTRGNLSDNYQQCCRGADVYLMFVVSILMTTR